MALPIYYPFKSRVLNATTITSNTVAEVAVAARAQLLDVWVAPLASQTAVGAIDITINGSTAAGAGAIATTTSTAGTAMHLYSAYSNSASINSTGGQLFLNAGDVLGTSSSSCVATNVTFVVKEF